MEIFGPLIVAAIFVGPGLLITLLPGEPMPFRIIWAIGTFIPALIAAVGIAVVFVVLDKLAVYRDMLILAFGLVFVLGGWPVFWRYMNVRRRHAS
jgi:hypothetical protein